MKKWMLGGALGVVVLGAGWGISQTLPSGPKLTKTFENATAQNLVDWLKDQGVQIDASKLKIDPSARFTISLKDVDKTSAVRAIAGALGYWIDQDGGKYKVRASDDVIVIGPDGAKALGPDFEKHIEKAFGPDFELKIQKAFGPDFEKKFEKSFGPDFQKHMEEWGKQFAKEMEQWGAHMKEFKIEGMPDGSKVRMWSNGKELDPEQMKKMHEQIRKAMESMPKMPAMPDMPKLPDMPKMPDMPKTPRVLRIESQNWDKLLDSLTADQWAKQKTQGFLKPSDLTADQRKMVSIPDGDGNFTITISKDGKTLTIKKG